MSVETMAQFKRRQALTFWSTLLAGFFVALTLITGYQQWQDRTKWQPTITVNVGDTFFVKDGFGKVIGGFVFEGTSETKPRIGSEYELSIVPEPDSYRWRVRDAQQGLLFLAEVSLTGELRILSPDWGDFKFYIVPKPK